MEFLNLPENYTEEDLQRAIVLNLRKFILEIGKDFTFVGEEYRVQVANSDYYIPEVVNRKIHV
jgi:predicted nuclease of restriction endonuclease-like (RecB) superfamily